jgi:hypothetical protein
MTADQTNDEIKTEPRHSNCIHVRFLKCRNEGSPQRQRCMKVYPSPCSRLHELSQQQELDPGYLPIESQVLDIREKRTQVLAQHQDESERKLLDWS